MTVERRGLTLRMKLVEKWMPPKSGQAMRFRSLRKGKCYYLIHFNMIFIESSCYSNLERCKGFASAQLIQG